MVVETTLKSSRRFLIGLVVEETASAVTTEAVKTKAIVLLDVLVNKL